MTTGADQPTLQLTVYRRIFVLITVVVASTSGVVYAVNAASGSVVWSGTAGAQIAYNSEQGGLAVGDGYLVVQAGQTITAWRLTPSTLPLSVCFLIGRSE